MASEFPKVLPLPASVMIRNMTMRGGGTFAEPHSGNIVGLPLGTSVKFDLEVAGQVITLVQNGKQVLFSLKEPL